MAAKKKDAAKKEVPVPEPITDLQFDDRVMRSRQPVLLLVGAPHSENSAIMEKEIRYIAPSYKGKLEFLSINADKNPETFGRYGIRSLPTLLFFKERSVVDRVVGVLLGGALTSRVDRLLSKDGDNYAYRGPRNLAQWAREHNIHGNAPYFH